MRAWRDLTLKVAGFSYVETAEMTGGRTRGNPNRHLTKSWSRGAVGDATTPASAAADDACIRGLASAVAALPALASDDIREYGPRPSLLAGSARNRKSAVPTACTAASEKGSSHTGESPRKPTRLSGDVAEPFAIRDWAVYEAVPAEYPAARQADDLAWGPTTARGAAPGLRADPLAGLEPATPSPAPGSSHQSRSETRKLRCSAVSEAL
jgi:hypothetical protein